MTPAIQYKKVREITLTPTQLTPTSSSIQPIHKDCSIRSVRFEFISDLMVKTLVVNVLVLVTCHDGSYNWVLVLLLKFQ